MKYIVLINSDKYACDATKKLEEQVKKIIGLGWKPLGGVSMSHDEIG